MELEHCCTIYNIVYRYYWYTYTYTNYLLGNIFSIYYYLLIFCHSESPRGILYNSVFGQIDINIIEVSNVASLLKEGEEIGFIYRTNRKSNRNYIYNIQYIICWNYMFSLRKSSRYIFHSPRLILVDL